MFLKTILNLCLFAILGPIILLLNLFVDIGWFFIHNYCPQKDLLGNNVESLIIKMYKAIGLICLILMSVTADMAIVKLPPVPIDEERTPNYQCTQLISTELSNDGADFLDGFAHGLSPEAYDAVKVWIKNI